ncbi:MAG: tetratricopeptide repeat protein [Cyanobacteria bacterium J06626_18]
MSLSLCMIVKNEAQNLSRCLASVQGYVDEMIVADTGSQDATVAIAQDFGAQVVSIEWTNDFAVARNQSLEMATGDWILVLDADEVVTAAGQTMLQQICDGKALENHALDSILVVNLLRHEVNADQTPYTAVSRLFRNRADVRFARPYHETVDDSVAAVMQAEPHWQVRLWSQVALEHTGYEATTIAQRDKFSRAQTIMEAYLAGHPNDAYICNKLGALYGQAGDWAKGRSLLQQGLVSPSADPFTTYELHYHLGLAARIDGQSETAAEHYEAALAQPISEILKVGAYINLGSLRKAQQDYLSAIEQFEKATQAAPQFAMGHFNLGTAHRARGYLDPAIAAYRQAIALDPNYAEAHQNLGVALFKLGKLPESLKAFQQAIALYQQTNPAEAMRLQQGIRRLGVMR